MELGEYKHPEEKINEFKELKKGLKWLVKETKDSSKSIIVYQFNTMKIHLLLKSNIAIFHSRTFFCTHFIVS